jgi:hypothetical protein
VPGAGAFEGDDDRVAGVGNGAGQAADDGFAGDGAKNLARSPQVTGL